MSSIIELSDAEWVIGDKKVHMTVVGLNPKFCHVPTIEELRSLVSQTDSLSEEWKNLLNDDVLFWANETIVGPACKVSLKNGFQVVESSDGAMAVFVIDSDEWIEKRREALNRNVATAQVTAAETTRLERRAQEAQKEAAKQRKALKERERVQKSIKHPELTYRDLKGFGVKRKAGLGGCERNPFAEDSNNPGSLRA